MKLGLRSPTPLVSSSKLEPAKTNDLSTSSGRSSEELVGRLLSLAWSTFGASLGGRTSE
jgi:hypothetical protein